MRKIVFVILMALVHLPAALIAVAGLVVIEALHAYRRCTTTLGRIRLSKQQRETFDLELQEAEFKAVNVGPTIL